MIVKGRMSEGKGRGDRIGEEGIYIREETRRRRRLQACKVEKQHVINEKGGSDSERQHQKDTPGMYVTPA